LGIVIAVNPSGTLDVLKEIAVVKAALLYADRVAICSPVMEMLACATAVAQAGADEQLDLLAELIPAIEPALLGPLQILKQVQKLKRKEARKLLSQLSAQLQPIWDEVNGVVDNLLEQAGAEELEKPLHEGLLTLDFLELRDTTTDAVVEGFTSRIQEYLSNARAYPLFDDDMGGFVEAGIREGRFTASSQAIAGATTARLGTGLIAKLPAFPGARMDDILETRQEVEQYVGKFRRAVSRMRQDLESTALDQEFPEELDAIFVSEVRAAMEEIQEALGASSLIRRLSGIAAASVGSAALGLALVAGLHLPGLVAAGVAGLAETAAIADSLGATAAGRRTASGHELFFLYRTQLRLESVQIGG